MIQKKNMDEHKLKLIIASAYAAVLSTVFVVVITVWGELSAPLKDALKNFSGHHWTSKSIFSALFYIIASALLYVSLRDLNARSAARALTTLLMSVVLGTIVLILFFTAHHFEFF